MSRLTVGTRGSRLALWQANHVAALLRDAHPDVEVVIRTIETMADQRVYEPFAALGTRGIFVKEIEQALIDETIDIAVHSLKDLPSELPRGLCLAALTRRHDPRDALLSPDGVGLDGLPRGARVGTGSLRRRSQLLHVRPDLRIEGVRGNLDTRIRKLTEGRFDALVLAVAGVERLEIDSVPFAPIEPEICLPAVGQGMLAIECREEDEASRRLCGVLEHAESAALARAERGFLAELGGGCLAPATAFADSQGDEILLRAFVGEPDGGRTLRREETASRNRAEELGRRVAGALLAAGAGEILAGARDAAGG